VDRLATPRNDGVAVDEVHGAAQARTIESRDVISNFHRDRLSAFASAVLEIELISPSFKSSHIESKRRSVQS
jgi:hypothetical protein